MIVIAKKEKKVEIIPNLSGELLQLVREYDSNRDQMNDLKEKQDEVKNKIIDLAKKNNISKARSQLLSFSWKIIKQTRIAEKKLKEILIAKGMENIIKDCEYEIEFPQVYIKKRKFGENIF